MISQYKVDEVIEISSRVCRQMKPEKQCATTAAEALDDYFSDLPIMSSGMQELENYLSELCDSDIFQLLYLYQLGRTAVDKNDPEKLSKHRKEARDAAQSIIDSGITEAIFYLTRNIERISKYLCMGQSLQ